MKKKICVVTGSRADYGILYPLLKKLKCCSTFDLQIVVTGMHVCREFGSTFQEIEKDGFRINGKVDIALLNDSRTDISKAVGRGCIGFADTFKRLQPDLVVVLGDRFEILAAAISAYIARIPIAHIHGGEVTEGAMDDAFRHSITKMSVLHFTSAQGYRKRVIQLGESKDRVFNVGALGVDNILSLKLRSRKELEGELDISFGARTALVTFHPATLEDEPSSRQFDELLKALDAFPGLKRIFTLPNADTGGKAIIGAINKYVKSNPARAYSFASLGRLNYLSVLNQVDVVVGNSSGGIIEAPSFRKPVVNVGSRQKGRIMAGNVINCRPRDKDIAAALRKAFSPGFIRSCRRVRSPYGDGKAAGKIVRIISDTIDTIRGVRKVFNDIQNV